MIRYLLAVMALSAPLAAEPVCEMRGAEPVPVIEAAKAEFLKGDFTAFAGVATEIMGRNAQDKLAKPIEQMEGLFLEGFESCQTVLQRRDVGGVIQEVSTFNIRGNDFPMSLYLLAMPIRGEWKIAYLNFDTSLTKVLSSLY